jgi:hypothetical protein
VPAILEFAELYSSTTSFESFCPILRISDREAPKQLVECEIAKVKTRVLRPVRQITFTISSHGHGWPNYIDTGSRTWFTARKSTPDLALLSDRMLKSGNRNDLEYSHHREIFLVTLFPAGNGNGARTRSPGEPIHLTRLRRSGFRCWRSSCCLCLGEKFRLDELGWRHYRYGALCGCDMRQARQK